MMGVTMHKHIQQHAFIPHPNGAHFPETILTIEARYQFAVTCGAQSATAFLNEHPEITLHTHLPVSLDYFLNQARQGAMALGVDLQGVDKLVTDAFLAGYLGRIQQELRTIRTPDKPRPLAAMH
jgi:hypothetical protein